MMDPTHSREMPSCSAIDLSEILRSSKISSWIWSIISGVVGLRTYQRPGVYNYGMVYCTCIGIESPVGRKVYYILSTARCRLPEDKPSGSKPNKYLMSQFKYINQLDTTTSQIYYLTFMYSSTCYGCPHAHHHELNNCSSSLWFYRWSVVVAVLLVVVGPVVGNRSLAFKNRASYI